MNIPRSLEVLIKKAAVDGDFRKTLIKERAAAAAQIGLELTAAETAMLEAIPEDQLKAIIACTTVPNFQRRAFLGKVAVAMLAALGAGAVLTPMFFSAGCQSRVLEVQHKLMELATAEYTFKKKHGRYATLKELINAGFIDEKLLKNPLYEFTLTLTGDTFEATALPRSRSSTKPAYRVGPDMAVHLIGEKE